MKNNFLVRILIFYIIAISVSNIFRFDIFDLGSKMAELPAWGSISLTLFLEGSGIFIGAFIAIYFLRGRKNPSFSILGSDRIKSILMLVIPIFLLSYFGVDNNYGLSPGIYGLLAGFGTLVYCFLEEFGWRGYLQQELSEVKPWMRYLLIGFLWYFWHLSFLTDTSVQNNLFFLGMLILGSWGIGQVRIATNSILACACLHFIINIMMFNQLIKTGISGDEKLIILGITVSAYIAILILWKKNKGTAANQMESLGVS